MKYLKMFLGSALTGALTAMVLWGTGGIPNPEAKSKNPSLATASHLPPDAVAEPQSVTSSQPTMHVPAVKDKSGRTVP
jgi:negative regulator of sigma E activity